jgi:hypothetical protein
MSILPPLLEPDGGRAAAGSLGPGAAPIRMIARVVALAGADAWIETGHGRALLQGAPALRPGAALVLELERADPALTRTGHIVAVDRQPLEPALRIRLQPAPPTPTAATMRSVAALEVNVRALGADGHPTTPAFTARLSVTLPGPAPAAPTSSASASLALSAAAPANVPPVARGPAGSLPSIHPAATPAVGRPAASPVAPHGGPGPMPPAVPAPNAAPAMPQLLGALVAQGHALEVIVLPRDALGRTLLRAAGVILQLDTPVDLPAGARLQLTVPGAARPGGAPPQTGPLEAVRTLAAVLREPAGVPEPAQPGTLRLPEPDANLAARLLRLVQLIAPTPAEGGASRPAGPAVLEGRPGAARITAALAELGRLAGEPLSGTWRVLLVPVAFEGAPLLRLYAREDCPRDGGAGERDSDRPGSARRAVFELEFAALGRCQIDVLCQARRFDLLVRTEQPLPRDLRREIRELYLAARDAAGLVGAARFRAGQLLVLPEPGGTGGPGGITV